LNGLLVTSLTFAVSSWIHSMSAGGLPSTSHVNVMVVPRSAWILRGRVRNLGPSAQTKGRVTESYILMVCARHCKSWAYSRQAGLYWGFVLMKLWGRCWHLWTGTVTKAIYECSKTARVKLMAGTAELPALLVSYLNLRVWNVQNFNFTSRFMWFSNVITHPEEIK
jgi:hypothetical protein